MKIYKEYKDSTMCLVEFECPICGKTHSMLLNEDDIMRYHKGRAEGKHIQDIFPDMRKQDREKFLTGYCEVCQKMIFGA